MVKIKLNILVLLLGVFLTFSSLSLAYDNGPGQVNVSQHRDGDRHVRHYYRNGRWYRPGWFGIGISVPVLSTGVYVDSLPQTYTPVVIQGTTYYYGDNTYFTSLPQGGYTVVAPPAH